MGGMFTHQHRYVERVSCPCSQDFGMSSSSLGGRCALCSWHSGEQATTKVNGFSQHYKTITLVTPVQQIAS